MTARLYLPEGMTPRNRTSSQVWVPAHLRGGNKPIAIVFYHHRKTGKIIVGFPESWPIPDFFKKAGYQKIVCRTMREVDKWDQRIRDQEKREEEMTDEQREAFEGPIRDACRKELVTKYMNARNPINKEFCRQALERIDADERRRKMTRESFMHIAGFEDGK